jgi:hypothetical protein
MSATRYAWWLEGLQPCERSAQPAELAAGRQCRPTLTCVKGVRHIQASQQQQEVHVLPTLMLRRAALATTQSKPHMTLAALPEPSSSSTCRQWARPAR